MGRRTLGNAVPSSGPAPASSSVTTESGHLTALGGLNTSDEEGVDGHLGLGELAQLTVNNEAEVSYDVSVRPIFIFSHL